jgi:2-keto-4-pentenoate hydratase
VNVRTYTRRTRTPLEPVLLSPSEVPQSLDAAYAQVNRQVQENPQRWRAWKLGGTNHGSRRTFNVTALYYGAIEAEESLTCPARAPGYPMIECKGEVEYALRISADRQGYDAWCVALEMPSTPITNVQDLGVSALVADRCAAGALILGSVHRAPLPVLDGSKLELDQDGIRLDCAGVENLTDHPEQILTDFLALASEHGLAPSPGDWVATGGVTACCPLSPGGHVVIRRDGQEELSFIVDTAAGR